MKLFVLILTCTICFNAHLSAQSCTPTFAKLIGSALSNEAGNSLAADPVNKLIYAAGSSNDSTLLICLNTNGDILWSRTFDALRTEPDRVVTILLDSDGMICISGMANKGNGGTIYAMKYDPALDLILWANEYVSHSNNYGVTMIEKGPGGNYLVSSNPTAPNDAELFEIDRNTGTINPNFSKHYHLGSSETLQELAFHNGGLYATGRFTDGGTTANMRNVLISLDADSGLSNWAKLGHRPSPLTARLYGTDLVIDQDQIYSISHGDPDGTNLGNEELFVQKTSLSGQTEWVKLYRVAVQDDVSDEIIATADGFIIMGRSRGPSDIFLFKINHAGDVLWANTYDFSANDNTYFGGGASSQVLFMDNALYFTAYTEEAGRRDMILVKTDSVGRVDDECVEIKPVAVDVSEVQNAVFYDIIPDIFTFIPDIIPLSLTATVNSLQINDVCSNGGAMSTTEKSICPGEIYEGHSQAGTYLDTFPLPNGCDSIVTLILTVSPADTTDITRTTCIPSEAGVFVTYHTNQFGCDSMVTETVTLNISHLIKLSSSSCNPADTGVFVQHHINQFGCDSIITETITLLPSDQTYLTGTTCLSAEAGMFITAHHNQYGCDSIVTLTISLLDADTTQLNHSTCDPAQTGSTETLFTGQGGCDSLVIETTTLYPLPSLIVESASDFNGFDIRCAGTSDGSAIATVNGVPPFSYLWSTNDTDQMITGLSAGNYEVAITDGNGCMTSGSVTLTAPDAFMIDIDVSAPDCFDQQLGSITVQPNGGVAPYTYSIDGIQFQSSPVFSNISEGIYEVTSFDANDCSAMEIISIDVPLKVDVELGENQTISTGDSVQLQAIINLPYDSLASVSWSGIDDIACADCLTQMVAPEITTTYTISVTTVDGCTDMDTLTVFVNLDYSIYVPNIFSPNGDGLNDVLKITAGKDVREIISLLIFDRWGNLVFAASDKHPDDPTLSWDGRMKGKEMNPGVFTYRLSVAFKDGRSEVRYGDVTLMR